MNLKNINYLRGYAFGLRSKENTLDIRCGGSIVDSEDFQKGYIAGVTDIFMDYFAFINNKSFIYIVGFVGGLLNANPSIVLASEAIDYSKGTHDYLEGFRKGISLYKNKLLKNSAFTTIETMKKEQELTQFIEKNKQLLFSKDGLPKEEYFLILEHLPILSDPQKEALRERISKL